MKRRIFILGLIVLVCVSAFPQVTIEECYRKARENYPLIKQYGLIDKMKDYNLANAGKGYLPQITFSAQATYQSDVTEIPIDPTQWGLQGVTIPKLSKDQYKVVVDVNQTLWDGGEIKSQKERIRTASEIEERNMDVTMYTINERVNQVFFGILLADERIKQIRLLKEDLQRTYKEVVSYVENGVANLSDLDAVRVDQLKAEQNETDYIYTRNAYMEVLSTLTGMEMNANTIFVKPDGNILSDNAIRRPELGLYDAQIRNYTAEVSQINAGLMPKFSLFVTGGYGKPSLNIFDNDFSPYYTAGVRLSWNIDNFYTQKKRRSIVQSQIEQVESQRATFLFNTNLDIVQKDKNIEKYRKQLAYDDEIIALKNAIRVASEAKMANGTLSGTDLMRDVNAEQTAIQDKILHEMELLLAVYDLKYVTNN